MKKSLLSLPLVFTLFLVSACGATPTPAPASPQKETPPASTAPAAAKTDTDEHTLEQIKKAGKLVIATGGNYRPYNYMDNNTLVGYDIDWGNLIAKEIGVKAEFVTGEFAGLIPGLTSKRFDIVLAGVNITDERKQTIDFSAPYSEDGLVAVVKKGSGAVKDVSDLKDKIVGANAGSAFEASVKKIGGYKELKPYPGAPQSFTDLIAGRLDVVAIGRISAVDYINNSPFGKELEIVGKPYDTKEVGVAIRKQNAELKALIDKVIADKKKDGTYAELTKKHFGFTFDK
ncbi:ABC transporter substrate-binding protein [Paenibacillus filicis]|uniref:ABC transporter substrate-binding protein n=1 Tax=Paenibacillus filicis TaxID=669464 RepID=A0ABU9DQY8_9BACL